MPCPPLLTLCHHGPIYTGDFALPAKFRVSEWIKDSNKKPKGVSKAHKVASKIQCCPKLKICFFVLKYTSIAVGLLEVVVQCQDVCRWFVLEVAYQYEDV